MITLAFFLWMYFPVLFNCFSLPSRTAWNEQNLKSSKSLVSTPTHCWEPCRPDTSYQSSSALCHFSKPPTLTSVAKMISQLGPSSRKWSPSDVCFCGKDVHWHQMLVHWVVLAWSLALDYSSISTYSNEWRAPKWPMLSDSGGDIGSKLASSLRDVSTSN